MLGRCRWLLTLSDRLLLYSGDELVRCVLSEGGPSCKFH